MAIGLLVNRETQSLLLGESATVEDETRIHDAIASTPGIDGVVNLRTIHLGPDDLVVAAGITVGGTADAAVITGSIVVAEQRIRAAVPFRTVIYLEPRMATPAADDTHSTDGAIIR